MEELKTPLYDAHVALGAKIVPFGGFAMPVQYPAGVIAEHMAVRNAAGLFDVSHMGEFLLDGKDALANLQMLLTNNYEGMTDGQARYSPMCNDEGGVVDDLIVYKKSDDHYFIIVNASNREKDFGWMKAHVFGDAVLTDVSDDYGLIALQGPKAMEILRKVTPVDKIPAKYYHAVFDSEVGGIPAIVSQTGYTGEEGVEICMAADKAVEVWNLLLEAGKEDGLLPCGLGARDTLRMEAAMPLYGHEMDDTVSPLEAGLKFAVKLDKEDFIGKAALESTPAVRKRVGLYVTGRGIIREHQDVYKDGALVGHTTSGTHCPYLGHAVALALVDREAVALDDEVEVDVRGRRVAAKVVKLPFYKREG